MAASVSPESSQGSYAYFVSIDASNQPAYPYMIDRQYCGVKQGGNWAAQSTIGFNRVETLFLMRELGKAAAGLEPTRDYANFCRLKLGLEVTTGEIDDFTLTVNTTTSAWVMLLSEWVPRQHFCVVPLSRPNPNLGRHGNGRFKKRSPSMSSKKAEACPFPNG